jgi:hypothetical protein
MSFAAQLAASERNEVEQQERIVIFFEVDKWT